QCLRRNRIHQISGNLVAGELRASVASVRIPHLRGGIENRYLLVGAVNPVGEIASVNFGCWNGLREAVGARAIAEGFVGEEEEGFVFPFVNFRNPDRAAYRGAEVMLLVYRDRDACTVVEEVVGIQGIVAEEFISRA